MTPALMQEIWAAAAARAAAVAPLVRTNPRKYKAIEAAPAKRSHPQVTHIPGIFLGAGSKSQGPKTQNQEIFRENSSNFFEKTQETGKCWEPFCLILQICHVYVSDFTQKRQNMMFLTSKLKEFSKTQWKLKDFPKTQGQNSPQSCKNSIFRKLRSPIGSENNA